jgi:hypothetical protein
MIEEYYDAYKEEAKLHVPPILPSSSEDEDDEDEDEDEDDSDSQGDTAKTPPKISRSRSISSSSRKKTGGASNKPTSKLRAHRSNKSSSNRNNQALHPENKSSSKRKSTDSKRKRKGQPNLCFRVLTNSIASHPILCSVDIPPPVYTSLLLVLSYFLVLSMFRQIVDVCGDRWHEDHAAKDVPVGV